jgi:phosphoenolpyruvate carboxykinase (ATP)
MPLAATRRMVSAALGGELDGVELRVDPVFGFGSPLQVEGVDPRVLDPRATWLDVAAYDAKLRELAKMFAENFETFQASAPEAVRAAGPRP